jgi:hypothetical protein
MAKSYADLWKEAADLESEGNDVANFNESVAKLPYELKDKFREKQDPALDKAINKAQSDTFGAAIKGLDMYQGISNPFARRNLAEQYQGIVEQGWKNLTDERTRRQGVYSDYIEKWTGLFGAEAAKRQDMFQNKMSVWEKEKSLADTEESTRRWNIEQANSKATASNKPYTEQEITSTIATLKNQGVDWGTINSFLAEKGVDTSTGSYADVQLNTVFESGNYPTKPTADRKTTELQDEQLRKIKMENDIVEQSRKKSDNKGGIWDYVKNNNPYSKFWNYIKGQ